MKFQDVSPNWHKCQLKKRPQTDIHKLAGFDIKYHNPICIEGKSDMKKIKKGDIVGRLSYGKDIYFIVERIIKTRNGDIAILKRINS